MLLASFEFLPRSSPWLGLLAVIIIAVKTERNISREKLPEFWMIKEDFFFFRFFCFCLREGSRGAFFFFLGDMFCVFCLFVSFFLGGRISRGDIFLCLGVGMGLGG